MENFYPQKPQSRKPLFFFTAIVAVVLFFAYSWLFKPSENAIIQKVFLMVTFQTLWLTGSTGSRGAEGRLPSHWHYHVRTVLSRWTSQDFRRNPQSRPFFFPWFPCPVSNIKDVELRRVFELYQQLSGRPEQRVYIDGNALQPIRQNPWRTL
jgi:hypothetical protein